MSIRTARYWDVDLRGILLHLSPRRHTHGPGYLDMLKEVILHIGCEKTGTNSLQAFLTQNATRLDQQGFHYPSGRFRSYFQKTGHFPVAAAHSSARAEYLLPLKQCQLPLVKHALRRDLGRLDGRAILSCEHFSSRLTASAQIEALAKTLRGFAVKVVCYVREQASLLLAAYSTDIRTGRKTRFQLSDADPENPYYNYIKMLIPWEHVFGCGRIVIVPYTRKSLVGGDICADFCSQVGLNFSQMQKVDDRYRSLDALQCEALRQLNLVLPDFADSPYGWRKAQALRRVVIKQLRTGPPLGSLLRPNEREAVQAMFCPFNDALAARYLPSGLPDDWLDVQIVESTVAPAEASKALGQALLQAASSGPRDVRPSATKAGRSLGLW